MTTRPADVALQLREIRDFLSDMELAYRDVHREPPWPSRRGEPVPVHGGGGRRDVSDPTGQTVALWQQWLDDRADEVKALHKDVLAMRNRWRNWHGQRVPDRTRCSNPACPKPPRVGRDRCGACEKYAARNEGRERPRELIERELDNDRRAS